MAFYCYSYQINFFKISFLLFFFFLSLFLHFSFIVPLPFMYCVFNFLTIVYFFSFHFLGHQLFIAFLTHGFHCDNPWQPKPDSSVLLYRLHFGRKESYSSNNWVSINSCSCNEFHKRREAPVPRTRNREEGPDQRIREVLLSKGY